MKAIRSRERERENEDGDLNRGSSIDPSLPLRFSSYKRATSFAGSTSPNFGTD